MIPRMENYWTTNMMIHMKDLECCEERAMKDTAFTTANETMMRGTVKLSADVVGVGKGKHLLETRLEESFHLQSGRLCLGSDI
jgi:hypothetical protein